MDYNLSATLELKDKFSATIKSATDRLTNFNDKVVKNNKEVSGFTKELKAMGEKLSTTKGIVATAGSAFAAIKTFQAGYTFFKDAFTGYAKLDAAITRNRAIMNASVEDTARLKEQVLELGKTMPFTAQEVAEAQYYQAMAGMKTNEVLELTPKLLKMAIASGQDLASTSDILTDNISAFGLKLEEADRLMDVMVATANNANTSVAGLGESYKYVASTSKSFESMEEVNILLGTLANNGIKAGQAGRNLAAVYTRLAKSTPDIDKALKVTGVSLYDNQKKFKGLRKIVEELRPRLAKMNDEQKNFILTTIFGSEQMKIITSLLGTSKEGFDTLAKAIYESEGASEKFYNTTKDTPENKIKELASAWDNLKLKVGEAAAPATVKLIENLTGKINELADSNTFSTENMQAFFNQFIGFLNETLDILKAIGILLKPIILGLKVVGAARNLGKEIGGTITTGKSSKQLALESEITDTDIKIKNMKPKNKEEEELRKKLFIENEKRKDSLRENFDTRAIMSSYTRKGIKKDSLGKRNDDVLEESYKFKYESGVKEKDLLALSNELTAKKNRDKTVILPPPVNHASSNMTPNINIDLGGVTINNEVDKEAVYNKVIRELDLTFDRLNTHKDTTR